jgi:spore coat protein U-like protein
MNSSSHTFQLELTDGCSINTTGVVGNIGSYPLLSGPQDVNLGTVAVTCVASVGYDWGIDGGTYYNALTRRMTNTTTAAKFSYELYAPAGGALTMGDCGLATVDASYGETTCPGGQPSFYGGLPEFHPGGGTSETFSLSGVFNTQNVTDSGIYMDTVNFVVAWM